MEPTITQLPPPVLPSTSIVETVTVSVKLFHKQRAICYLVASVIGSGLLAVALPWLAGPTKFVFLLGALLFFLLPFASVFMWRDAYIKSALLSFTPHGLDLEASDKHYQVEWTDLVAYQVQFILGKLIGDGYRLTLQDAEGHSVVLNLLEPKLINPSVGLRSDSGLAYLCRYIGWQNRQQEKEIVLRPGLLARKTGVVLLVGLGALVLIDVAIRVLSPSTKGTSIGVLAGALALGLQVLGQKKQNDRYAHYLQSSQEEGIDSYDVTT